MKKKPTWEKQENMNFQNARIVKLKIEFVELEYNLKTEPKLPLTTDILGGGDWFGSLFHRW